jgi:hypothetical protein
MHLGGVRLSRWEVTTMAKVVKLTEAERKFLAHFLAEDLDTVDAKLHADAIWSLLNKGLIQIGGTLQSATVTLTRAGVAALGGEVSA